MNSKLLTTKTASRVKPRFENEFLAKKSRIINAWNSLISNKRGKF